MSTPSTPPTSGPALSTAETAEIERTAHHRADEALRNAAAGLIAAAAALRRSARERTGLDADAVAVHDRLAGRLDRAAVSLTAPTREPGQPPAPTAQTGDHAAALAVIAFIAGLAVGAGLRRRS